MTNGSDASADTRSPAAGATFAVLVLTAMNLLNYVDRYVPSAVKPLFQRELHFSDAQSSYPTTAFIVVYMAASPLFGALADRYERKRLIAAGVALWSMATASAAFAIGFKTFLASRAAVGIGEAAYATLSPSVISDFYPADRRNRILTIFYLAIPVGAALGFWLGGVVGASHGWRAAFLVCGLPGLFTAALALSTREPARGAFDEAPESRPSIAWPDALVSLAGNRTFVLAVAGYALVTFASGALADWFPTFLVRSRGVPLAHADLIVGATGAIGGLVGTFSGGLLADRLKGRTRQPYFGLSGLSMVAATVFAILAFTVRGEGPIAACILFAQIFLWFYNGPINAMIVNSVGSELRARAIAVSILCIHLFGDAASPSVVGLVSDRTHSLAFALSLVPVMLGAGAAVWLVAWRALPENPESGWLHVVLRALALVVMRVFYRQVGMTNSERVPARGPVIVVANHPNGLLDPLVARRALRRPLAFLAKSTFFTHFFGRLAMRAFDAIPVYRQQDGADTKQNEETFRRCRELLKSGGWLMLFPEGKSHSEPKLQRLKTGAARIALSAEAESDFTLGIKLLPLGLFYEDKTIFRSRVGVAAGELLSLENYRERYSTDERGAVEALTGEVDRALSDVVLEADDRELWNGFVAAAAWTSDDAGEDVAALEARSRALARGYRRLSADDPARAQELVDKTRRFAASLRTLGIDDPFSLEKPVRPRLPGIVGFVLPLVTLWPVALVGALLGWPAYRLVGFFANRAREPDVKSSIKAIGGLVVILPGWIVEGIVAGIFLGPLAGLAVFALGPLAGYVAVRFEERLRARREILRGLWLRASGQDLAREVTERRRELARDVAAELEHLKSLDGAA